MKKFYGDGSYDTNALFDYLEKENIESAIKIRSNASNHYCRGSRRRGREVREYQRLGYEQWAEKKEYGRSFEDRFCLWQNHDFAMQNRPYKAYSLLSSVDLVRVWSAETRAD